MKLRFLGTGTSYGVPVVGCDCPTCTSPDPRDQRTRHAALLESEGRRLLVDTPPELRLQLLAAGIDHVDGVWITHCHADHIHGIDDLRAVSVHWGEPLDVRAGPQCAETLRRRFDYIFDDDYHPPRGTSKPGLRLSTLTAGETVELAGFRLLALEIDHGVTTVFGFRVGNLGYITDAKRLPDATRRAIEGVDVLVLNALWFGRPHPTHMNVEEAVGLAENIGAARTYLTHLTHRVRHQELLDALPSGVEPAHDGLEITVEECSST